MVRGRSGGRCARRKEQRDFAYPREVLRGEILVALGLPRYPSALARAPRLLIHRPPLHHRRRILGGARDERANASQNNDGDLTHLLHSPTVSMLLYQKGQTLLTHNF